MKTKIILIISAVLFLSILAWWLTATKIEIVYLGNVGVQVEIADNALERYQGLSGRDKICGECGMLFVFEDEKPRTFSMRGMNFPLDFIWIKNNVIIEIDENIYPAQSGGEVIINGPACDYALEVNAGFVEARGISVGDRLNF